MGIGERQPESDAKAAEEGCLKPLTGKSPEKTANNNKGIWQKLRSSTVPLLYVVIGAAILVTVIIILIILTACPSVRASAGSDEDLAFLEKSTGETPKTKVVEVPIYVQCEDDWVLYIGKCYYFSHQTATWTDSQNFCKSHNSSLAIIHNETELNFLNLLKMNYWIGLSRTQDDLGWVWTDGTFHLETIFDILRTKPDRGEEEHVYQNGEGFKSGSGRYKKRWICSKGFSNHSS